MTACAAAREMTIFEAMKVMMIYAVKMVMTLLKVMKAKIT